MPINLNIFIKKMNILILKMIFQIIMKKIRNLALDVKCFKIELKNSNIIIIIIYILI